jgi:hypothetical protein
VGTPRACDEQLPNPAQNIRFAWTLEKGVSTALLWMILRHADHGIEQ